MLSAYDDSYSAKLNAKTEVYRRLDRNSVYVFPIIKNVPVGDSVLDMATGMSDIPFRLVKAGYEVFAIDSSEHINGKFRQPPVSEAKFFTGDILRTPFGNGQFQGIILKDILEHIPTEKISALFLEVDRLLQKQGTLVIGCPARTFASRVLRVWNKSVRKDFSGIDDTGDTTHVHWFTEAFLLKTVKTLGYHVEDIRYLMYGVNNFPRIFILPLYYLQKTLYQSSFCNFTISKLIQRLFGFRVMLVLRKL